MPCLTHLKCYRDADIEELYDPQPEVTLEDEDDDHKANQPRSEREIRELFKLHRNIGHP